MALRIVINKRNERILPTSRWKTGRSLVTMKTIRRKEETRTVVNQTWEV
jgi:hypothetical protein